MFVDRVEIYCKAGDGGDGCVSFRRETHVPRGGPNGGEGGKGGSIVIEASTHESSLSNLVGHKHWNADRGKHGEGNLRTGRSGADVVIKVPRGTLIKDSERGHLLKDLTDHEERIVVAKGGKGGKGNKHFASSINRTPREFGKGELGEQRNVVLELKVIADVGLIGLPNAGKSTLLSRLSRAQPEIASYPFTTKYPNLGIVNVGYDHQYVLADIPGLIEGAHAGVGLGHEFLKHVERTRILVHLVEPSPMDGSDPVENYRTIRGELQEYDSSLAERKEIAVVTKSELPDAEPAKQLLEEEFGKEVLLISAVTGKGLPVLSQKILKLLNPIEEF